ncbi:hypothetical protein Hanom_Chr14g01262381 [Helianthus anomalus]
MRHGNLTGESPLNPRIFLQIKNHRYRGFPHLPPCGCHQAFLRVLTIHTSDSAA